jgi:hypothetical protein
LPGRQFQEAKLATVVGRNGDPGARKQPSNQGAEGLGNWRVAQTSLCDVCDSGNPFAYTALLRRATSQEIHASQIADIKQCDRPHINRDRRAISA